MYLDPPAKALMQLPSASSDLLMFDPSRNLTPLPPEQRLNKLNKTMQ